MSRLDPRRAYLGILAGQGAARGLMFAALLSYWVVQARLTPFQLVLLGTALEGVLFLCQVPTGAFADAYGRRGATVIGYFLLAVSLGLQVLTRDFAWLLVLQALAGLAWAFLIGSQEAWIAGETSGEELQRVLLRGGQLELLGLMLGLALTLALGQADPRLPIVAGAFVLLAVSLLAALLMRELRSSDGNSWRRLPALAAAGLGSVWASRLLFLLVLMALVLGAASEGWDRLYVAHLVRDLGLGAGSRVAPVSWLALVGLGQCGLGAAAFQLALRRAESRRPASLLALLCVARAAAMLGFAFGPGLPPALAGFFAAEALRNLAGPVLEAWVARETAPAVRATVLSTVGQADALGQILAGPLVGLLGSLASIPLALAGSAGLLLPAALLVRCVRPRMHASEAPA